ncbi:MAG: SUMF1/EgtB/PvdO family nonheme iron enzyme [Kiritimatiellae bacterium]|nr:SUMF1/EgtB/PvdO family nonheme iron enzyme [Kiritimatiellia bacterium]
MKRKALFVGVNEYQDAQIENLRYAVGDASEIQAQFKFCGFETKLLPDPARGDVEKWVEAMTAGLGTGDLFVFYFAGHGFMSPGGGDELLFCKDDKYANLQYNRAGIPFSMLRDITLRNGQNSIFILDACRSNFFSGQRGKAKPRDLVPMSAMMGNRGGGTYAVWRSCGSGQSALELESLGHGIFTYAIDRVMTHCRDKKQELVFGNSFLKQVYERMGEAARANSCYTGQKPESEKTVDWPRIVLIEGDDQMVSNDVSLATVTCPLCGSRNEEDATFRCRICGRDYLCKNHYDQSANCCSDCAEKMRVSQSDIPLSGGATSSSPASYPTAGTVKTLMLPGGAKLELVYCPPGTFWMGSENGEVGRSGDETYHRVILTKGFWLGKYPVTQGQWKSVMGNNPSKFTGNDALPVEQISWKDCQEFLKKVNTELHCAVRLPTEAEWEYACRAGTTGPYGGTGKLGQMGWWGSMGPIGSLFRKTYLVGQKKPNAWGLCDMHGNVWEWCADWYGKYLSGDATDPIGPATGSYRVQRGGCWRSPFPSCRSASRSKDGPLHRSCGIGFRLCCSAEPCGS